MFNTYRYLVHPSSRQNQKEKTEKKEEERKDKRKEDERELPTGIEGND